MGTSLLDAGPRDRAFVTRRKDDGSVIVQFGDGKNGGRPPTGQTNVRATYRKGIGAAGNVAAGQLSQAIDRPAGLKGVANPAYATGGADPDKPDDARKSAPLHVRTLERVVSLQDYENYLSRLRQISRVFEQITTNMRRGISDKLMQPRYLLEKVSPEAEEVAKQSGESSPFFGPLKQFPASIPAADQKRLRDDALNVIATQIVPAYQKFAVFVHDEFHPGAPGRTMIRSRAISDA